MFGGEDMTTITMTELCRALPAHIPRIILWSLYYDTALSANIHVFSSLRQLVPASHILLGTDYPFTPAIESGSTAARLAALPGFSEQELQEIEGENALRLFPRLH